MAIDITKVPQYILRDVREYVRDNNLHDAPKGPEHLVEDADARAVDDHIMSMTSDDLIQAWLHWNGIVGWTQAILCVVDRAREAEYH